MAGIALAIIGQVAGLNHFIHNTAFRNIQGDIPVLGPVDIAVGAGCIGSGYEKKGSCRI